MDKILEVGRIFFDVLHSTVQCHSLKFSVMILKLGKTIICDLSYHLLLHNPELNSKTSEGMSATRLTQLLEAKPQLRPGGANEILASGEGVMVF